MWPVDLQVLIKAAAEVIFRNARKMGSTRSRPKNTPMSLGGDIRTAVDDLRKTEERPLGILHGINDVVAIGRLTWLASEVVTGITQLTRFLLLNGSVLRKGREGILTSLSGGLRERLNPLLKLHRRSKG